MTLYRTIVADPPWDYPLGGVSSVNDGRRSGRRSGMRWGKALPYPYPSMTVSEIRELPVSDLAERSASLFLWTTNRYLPDSFSVVEAWGFSYRQLLVWDKGSSMSPFGGSITPNRAEFCLFCRRGAGKMKARWPGGSVIYASKGSRPGTHSRKPDVFLDLVETVSPGPYLELFARRQRLGWDTWGDEALQHVELSA